jgi:hypothetical protein
MLQYPGSPLPVPPPPPPRGRRAAALARPMRSVSVRERKLKTVLGSIVCASAGCMEFVCVFVCLFVWYRRGAVVELSEWKRR